MERALSHAMDDIDFRAEALASTPGRSACILFFFPTVVAAGLGGAGIQSGEREVSRTRSSRSHLRTVRGAVRPCHILLVSSSRSLSIKRMTGVR